MRGVCLILVMASTLLGSFTAFGQAQSQPVPPPDIAPPPAVAPPPQPAAEWPTSGEAQRMQAPLSKRLVLNRGPKSNGALWFERNGVLITASRYADGLDLALTGSDRAVNLARQSHEKLVRAGVLTWTGVGLTLLALVGEVAVAVDVAANNNSSNNGSNSTVAAVGTGASLAAVIVGLVLEGIGVSMTQAGFQLECDAVNAYNEDLVDGKLRQ